MNWCSLELMKKSIKELILPLRKETMILPGHGPFSSVGTEALFNPVVGKKGNQWIVCSDKQQWGEWNG